MGIKVKLLGNFYRLLGKINHRSVLSDINNDGVLKRKAIRSKGGSLYVKIKMYEYKDVENVIIVVTLSIDSSLIV